MDMHSTTTHPQRDHPEMVGAEIRPLAARWTTGFGAWLQQRRTERLLMACSDRVLADIGIARADIPLVARGQDPLQAHERPGWLASLRTRFAEALAARREWRRQQAELMSYTDRELLDIGIKRRDIPAIIRDAGPATV